MVDAISIFFLAVVVAASPAIRPATPEPLATAADTVAVAAVLSTASGVNSTDVIAFAQTLKGTPYKYACADPDRGFDCSGFVMYVFNHFQMTVPRSSIAFTNIGREIELPQALPGDLILFTGTDASIRKVGHVGIITQSGDSPSFIHASSGKAHSVTETTLSPHYRKRFIKVVRLLE